jgi:transcriptional regulator with XRE-family HTH domain
MTMKTNLVTTTFGQIYQRSLGPTLQMMGNNFNLLRKSRQKDIDAVAGAINVGPEILDQIEKGEHDPSIETFFALCNYYNVDFESVVGKGVWVFLKLK